MKNKFIIATIGVVSLISSIFVFHNTSLDETTATDGVKEYSSYTLTMDSNINKVESNTSDELINDTIYTELNNPINISYRGLDSSIHAWGKTTNNDFFMKNLTPINGISTVSINYEGAGNVEISFGYYSNEQIICKSDYITLKDNEVMDISTYGYSYFEIYSDTSNIIIESLVFTYVCDKDFQNESLKKWNIPEGIEITSNKKATNIASKLSNKATTSTKYYLQGYIKKIENVKTGILYIKDRYGDDFYIYKLLYEDVSFANLTNQPILGDVIIVSGYLKNYNGTYEIEKGELISINSDLYSDLINPTPGELTSITIDSSSDIDGSYDTGNYGSVSIKGIDFEYYRTTDASNYAFKMIKPNYYYASDVLPSMFYNAEVISDIHSVDITYNSTGGLILESYSSRSDKTIKTLEATNSDLTISVTFSEPTGFIKLKTINSDAYIKSITINYSRSTISYDDSYLTYEGNRYIPDTFNSELINGVTHTMKCSDKEERTYTYYTSEYVKEHINEIDIEEAILTDPVDIANYYLIFHAYPSNFIDSSEISTYQSIYGSYLRRIATYNRTSGYARSVPYNTKPGSSYPIYHELDIDIDGTYHISGSRGTGRVVIWEYGFSCYSDTTPVIVYTDDHYFSFSEYNNAGEFLYRFNAEGHVSDYNYNPLMTL